ncbi:MAG TPA: HAMP domain-containing sensor histidine kinase [Fimbriiglobus sp.]|nr:HAMP domain-containing sensor histidine kinase [Fimbriiglobus sp.]
MARPWRLRHKLVLGLALVVGSVALLLGGALFGLSSYLETMQTTRRKLERMQIVVQLRDHIQRISFAGQGPRANDAAGSQFNSEKEQVLDAIRATRLTAKVHADTLKANTDRLDPDDSEDEARLIERLGEALTQLERAVNLAAPHPITSPANPQQLNDRLLDDPEVNKAHTLLTRYSNELFQILITDINHSFERSDANHRRSLTVAGFATALAVVLVLTLLYYFRVWVFTPIKLLQAGVHRVHEGNFDHPIRLGSKDELEELANEFNAMTARLREVYKDLARQVNERTRQLVRSERMVSVGFLAAGVAHEINNPLASIAFCAEALERRLHDLLARAPGESEVVLKYLRMMQDEAQRCKQITHKLLDFSRSGGKREPAELTQLIQDVIEVAQCLPTARGKRIVFQPNAPVMAPVRVPEVKGVVLNVVVNGLESMEEGGVLTVALAVRGEFAEMTFADTGCGMTPDVLENLFEPFFTRSRTGHGTGLGLATSHLVIDQHGGTIAVASGGPGKGSTFAIRLPLRSVGAGDSAGEKSADPEGRVLAFPGARTVAA